MVDGMQQWRPDPDAPQLLDWWVPLVRASRHAIDAEVPWLILIDEWELGGRVERQGRPDVWLYVHRRSGGELRVDDNGQPYRFIPNSSGPSPGRLRTMDIRHALCLAGLPNVSEPVWFEPMTWSDPPDGEGPLVDDDEPRHRPALHLVR